jgi:hypothetical protein
MAEHYCQRAAVAKGFGSVPVMGLCDRQDYPAGCMVLVRNIYKQPLGPGPDAA